MPCLNDFTNLIKVDINVNSCLDILFLSDSPRDKNIANEESPDHTINDAILPPRAANHNTEFGSSFRL